MIDHILFILASAKVNSLPFCPSWKLPHSLAKAAARPIGYQLVAAWKLPATACWHNLDQIICQLSCPTFAGMAFTFQLPDSKIAKDCKTECLSKGSPARLSPRILQQLMHIVDPQKICIQQEDVLGQCPHRACVARQQRLEQQLLWLDPGPE